MGSQSIHRWSWSHPSDNGCKLSDSESNLQSSRSLWMNHYYRPQRKFAKVMFLHVSVCPQGISVQGGLHAGGRSPSGGGLCPGECLCWGVSVQGTVSVQGVSVHGGGGSLSRGVSVWGGSLSWRHPPYGNERAVRILLECILVFCINMWSICTNNLGIS